MEKVTIILPVKNEEVGLSFLLESYNKSGLQNNYDINFIIIIHSMTTDSSEDMAQKFQAQIFYQSEDSGKGAAIKQVISTNKEILAPKIIFLDADGSYCFESVSRVIEALNQDVDMISGSRFLGANGKPQGMSNLHHFGNKILSFTSSIRNRKKITDLCTGLWGFHRDKLMALKIKSNGFDIEAEFFGLSRRNKLTHKEVSVKWSERKGGVSKLRSMRDGAIILKRIIIT